MGRPPPVSVSRDPLRWVARSGPAARHSLLDTLENPALNPGVGWKPDEGRNARLRDPRYACEKTVAAALGASRIAETPKEWRTLVRLGRGRLTFTQVINDSMGCLGHQPGLRCDVRHGRGRWPALHRPLDRQTVGQDRPGHVDRMPSAWDYMVRQERPGFVRMHLRDGGVIGGMFFDRSFVYDAGADRPMRGGGVATRRHRQLRPATAREPGALDSPRRRALRRVLRGGRPGGTST